MQVSATNSCGTSGNRSLTVSINSACREVTENEIADEPSFSIFPNPGAGLFTLKASGFENQAEIQVYNMLGQLVKTQKVNALISESQLDLSNFASGAYLIKFEHEDLSKSLKLIKQ